MRTQRDLNHYSSDELAAWIRRELDEGDVPELELHLSICRDCAFRARVEYDLSAQSGRSSAAAHAAARAVHRVYDGLLSIASRMTVAAADALFAWINSGRHYQAGMMRVTSGKVCGLPGLGTMPVPEMAFRGQERDAAIRRMARIPCGGFRQYQADVFDARGTLIIRFPLPGRDEPAPRVFLLELNDPDASEELVVRWNETIDMWDTLIDTPPPDYCIAIIPPFEDLTFPGDGARAG
jgi:hypothetical protein